jgi:hypothetical protein
MIMEEGGCFSRDDGLFFGSEERKKCFESVKVFSRRAIFEV